MIAQEYYAAHQGLEGLASESARHTVIKARMARIEVARAALVDTIGETAAGALIAATLDEAIPE